MVVEDAEDMAVVVDMAVEEAAAMAAVVDTAVVSSNNGFGRKGTS